MTHDEARLLIGAAPGEVGSALAEHLADCAECRLFQQQMQHLDQDLAQVFAAPLPARPIARVVTLPTVRMPRKTVPQTRSTGWMALAASVVLSVAMGTLFWSLRPVPSLAAGVVGHVEAESSSWSEVAPMTLSATATVLNGAGVTLDPADTTITYARTCLFNGHLVPHLVVQTPSGPVTLMVLNQEHVAARQSFRQNGYSGVLVPSPSGGTLAVITRGDPDLDAVERALAPHLHWTP